MNRPRRRHCERPTRAQGERQRGRRTRVHGGTTASLPGLLGLALMSGRTDQARR